MAADGEGNLYLADRLHHRIRKVDPKGRITTFAGTGAAAPSHGGFNGNERPASRAELNRPFDVKLGPQRRVYITDDGNGQVRYVDEAGIIHAGFGSGLGLTWKCQRQKSLPATGPELNAEAKRQKQQQRYGAPLPARPELPTNLGSPSSLASGGSVGVYVATPELGQVKLIEPSGVVSTAAGNGKDVCQPAKPCPPSGREGGPALSTRLGQPTIVEALPGKGVYVFDKLENRVRFVNQGRRAVRVNGVKVAPGAIAGIAGQSVDALPKAATVGGAGGETPGNAASGATTPGGPGSPGSEGKSSKAIATQLKGVTSLAADGMGNLFIAEPEQHRIRRVDDSGEITTFIGEGGDFDAAASGCCPSPSVVSRAGKGNLYVYDTSALKIFLVNRGKASVTVHGQAILPGSAAPIAGSGKAGFGGDNGPALSGSFTSPSAMSADGKGNLYIADPGESTVRKVDSRGVITTAAGAGVLTSRNGVAEGGFNGDGLKGQLTAFASPSGVALDRCGNLLIADSGNDRVRRLNLAGPCGPAAASTDPARPAGFRLTPMLIVPMLAAMVAGTVIVGLIRRKR